MVVARTGKAPVARPRPRRARLVENLALAPAVEQDTSGQASPRANAISAPRHSAQPQASPSYGPLKCALPLWSVSAICLPLHPWIEAGNPLASIGKPAGDHLPDRLRAAVLRHLIDIPCPRAARGFAVLHVAVLQTLR